MQAMSDRLWEEMKRRQVYPVALDLAACVPAGTTQNALRDRPLERRHLVMLAVALELPPSYLTDAVRDPTRITWSDRDMRNAQTNNNIWARAIAWGLSGSQTGQLFDGVMAGSGRMRRGSVVSNHSIDETCEQLFGATETMASNECPDGGPCFCGAPDVAARSGRCPVPKE
jgi:hypothetical protein